MSPVLYWVTFGLNGFVQCVKSTIQLGLENKSNQIKCMIPALSYLDINSANNLEYCNNTEDALAVNGLIYKEAQKIQVSIINNHASTSGLILLPVQSIQ